MAQKESQTATRTPGVPGEPVLRQGRAADPVPVAAPAGTMPSDTTGDATPPEEPAPSASTDVDEAPAATGEDTAPSEPESDSPQPDDPQALEKSLAEARQRKLRLMLRQCDRVLLMDFDILSMSGWPDNYSLSAARRSRDAWVFSALIAAMIFLSGLTGFVPAWIAGGGFGAFVIILLLGVPGIRRIYTSRPSYLDLILKRQHLMRDARKHINHLEGKEGLVWQCARMADYNPSLRSSRFSDLLALSEQRTLARNMTRREYVRLYLIYLLEAEKAYDRVQKAFFDGNQEAMDQGWASVAASPGQRA